MEGTDEFTSYIRELNWAQKFALLNREEMMDRVIDCAIPAAYKDIDQVMVDAADLVKITHTLHQVVNVKGD